MTNLESILKSTAITLPTRVHIVKVLVFQLSCIEHFHVEGGSGKPFSLLPDMITGVISNFARTPTLAYYEMHRVLSSFPSFEDQVESLPKVILHGK